MAGITGRPSNKRSTARRCTVLAAVAVAGLALPACSSSGGATGGTAGGTTGGTTGGNGGSIVIGATIDEAGSFAARELQVLDGLKTAINEVNSSGGINGKKIELKTLDDQADPSKAVVNFNQFKAENATAIFAFTLSGAFSPLYPLARQDKIPVIAPSLFAAGAPAFNFGTGPVPTDSIAAEFSFAQDQVLKAAPKRVAFAGLGDVATSVVPGYLTKRLSGVGGSLVDTEGIDATATSVSVQAAKIAAAKPDLVLLSLNNVLDGLLVPALRASGVTAPIVDWWGGYSLTTIKQLNDPGFYVYYNYIDPTAPSAAIDALRQSAKAAGVTVPSNASFTGAYLSAKALFASLKACNLCSGDALNKALEQNSDVADTGLGPEVGFSSSSHTFTHGAQFVHVATKGGDVENVGEAVTFSP